MVTDNHLQAYLEELMENLKDIRKFQTNLKDSSCDLPENINWNSKIKH